MDFHRVAVIGAGVMGAGIAAHIANAGVAVDLLGRPAGTAGGRSAAEAALDRLRRAEPPVFASPAAADRITPGTVAADFGRLAAADWIIEAVTEDLAVKRAVFAQIEAVRRPGTAISSTTSTLALRSLNEGRSPEFRAHFLITHFFNPPGTMRLVEMVAGPETRLEIAAAVRDFATRHLGKSVVAAQDTPGFIANRIGAVWVQSAVNAAFDLGLSVDQADAVLGAPLGMPKTGVFGLLDLTGIDLMPQVARGLSAALPPDDLYCTLLREHPLIARMIAEGRIGRKAGAGFYRLVPGADGQRVKHAIDLATGAYRPAAPPAPAGLAAAEAAAEAGEPRALLGHPGRAGRFAWRVMADTLSYAASLVPAICESAAGVDEAMRLGYAWQWGPFELIDRIGAGWFAGRLRAERRAVPPLLEAAVRDGGFCRHQDRRPQDERTRRN